MAIRFTLNGQEVEAQEGETIWQVAHRLGEEIPHLCYSPEPGYRPDGNCRACMVEIEGERVLAASCIRKPAAWSSSCSWRISRPAPPPTIRIRSSGTGPTGSAYPPRAFPRASGRRSM